MSKEPSLEEVFNLAKEMGVEVKIGGSPTFKGGTIGGRKVVIVPEDSLDGKDANIAMLHELGHIRFGHSESRNPKQFVLNELEADRWALTTKCGYPQEEWNWSLLPGIVEDAADKFGLSLRDAWRIAKEAARSFGVSSSSLQKAEEELKNR